MVFKLHNTTRNELRTIITKTKMYTKRIIIIAQNQPDTVDFHVHYSHPKNVGIFHKMQFQILKRQSFWITPTGKR